MNEDHNQSAGEQKAALRKSAAARRNNLAQREYLSATIRTRVLGLPEFAAADAIHCYLPIRSEVDTRPIVAAAFAAGKRVAIPVTVGSGPLEHSWIDTFDPDVFSAGALGTPRPNAMRPAKPGEWSLTIVPMLAFDRERYRLGYGKGLYDRLLATISGVSVGVAFAAQEIAMLPHEDHDIRLDMIVTEHEIIK